MKRKLGSLGWTVVIGLAARLDLRTQNRCDPHHCSASTKTLLAYIEAADDPCWRILVSSDGDDDEVELNHLSEQTLRAPSSAGSMFRTGG